MKPPRIKCHDDDDDGGDGSKCCLRSFPLFPRRFHIGWSLFNENHRGCQKNIEISSHFRFISNFKRVNLMTLALAITFPKAEATAVAVAILFIVLTNALKNKSKIIIHKNSIHHITSIIY